jgi:hypothetical protein
MKIHTMAMQISDKNWSVAAAILGREITSKPMARSYGNFVVINTFEDGSTTRSSARVEVLILHNIVVSSQDFMRMFDYDKRTKNLETFFEVTQVASRPIEPHPDQELDQAINKLNEVWRRED